MIHMDTPFFSSWFNADGSRDTFMKTQLVVSKIGECIAKDKPDILRLLKNRGVNLSMQTKDDKYIQAIIDQGRRSAQFRTDLAKLMFEKSNIEKNAGGIGEFFTSESGGKAIESAASLLGTLIQKRPQVIVESAKRNYERPFTSTTGFKIGFPIALIAIAGIVIYFVIKKSNGQQSVVQLQ
jgi:hypothetical protein